MAASLFLAGPLIAEDASSSDSTWQKSFEEKVAISGFARVVGGYLDTDQAEFSGYDDSLSFGQESLFAVQLDAQLSDTLSFTTQVLAHKSNNRDSGIEWAYLSYSPNRNWQVRLGKQRTPFYTYSDVLDVGYAYPYISAPVQIYSDNIFTSYEGATVSYQTSFNEFLVSAEGFWGSFDEDVTIDDLTIRPDVNDLRGIILRSTYGNLTARVGHYKGDVNLQIPEFDFLIQQFRFLNFNRTADSLVLKGSVSFDHIGLTYKSLTWFAEAEASVIKSDVLLIPEIKGYSVLAGYQFDAISVYAMLADSRSDSQEPVNEIPIGFDPGLDQLAFAYRAIFDEFGSDDLRSYTLGVRYDLDNAMALKASVTRLDGEPGARSFFEAPQPQFDRQATLYQIALEWVF